VTPEVLFVSKPVVAPFNDGSKCLVRDIAGALTTYTPRLMVTQGASVEVSGALEARVYAGHGGYSPPIVENARVFAWLLARSRAQLWHFLFAPNPRTSQVGKLLKRLRRVPIVQTIASPPRSFRDPQRLLFGDVAVAQSQWTKRQFLAAYEQAGIADIAPLEVIPPAVPDLPLPSVSRMQAMRAKLEIEDDAPILLYPGDIEVERPREAIAAMLDPLLRESPNARVVFAYRHKTPRSALAGAAVRSQLASKFVRFIAEVPDMHALVATSRLLLFPVDELYGKVDLPIVVLEAMQMGVPVVTLDQGPLADLGGVWQVHPGDRDGLVRVALRALTDEPARQSCCEAQHLAIQSEHTPARVARRYEAIYDGLLRQA